MSFCVTAMPLVVACNDLIGLSDYKRGECSGGGLCSDAGWGDSGPHVDGSIDAGRDVQSVDASGTKPVRWAQFVMPNYAQDGGPGDNVPTYNPTDGGLVDSVTSLVWREPIAQNEKGPKSYEEAQKICAGVTTGGRWRLPSRIELVTLLHLEPTTKPKKIDDAFSSTEPTSYWTTSEVRPDVQGVRKHWTVDFANGGLTQTFIEGGTAGVRCIKDL
jgi:hypothetical protein